MKVYTVHEAKSQLSKLIKDVLSGKAVAIGQRREPVVVLSLYNEKKRVLGTLEGGAWMSDDFDAPSEEFSEYTE